MAFTPFIIAISATISILYLSFSHYRSKRPPKGFRLVPGPKGLPLIGNTHQLKLQPQRQFHEWAKQYGELFQIQMGWENWVFLCSPESVKEILDKQSAVTSGRAPMPVGSDLISGGMRFLLMGYTPTWRKLRTIVHKLLTPKMSETFRPSQEFEAKQLVFDILKNNGNGEKFYQHVRR
jgi:cytochrome P450